jgi:hypothetical protein
MTQHTHVGDPRRKSFSQEMIVAIVFMAEHVTKKVLFNLTMKGMLLFRG